MRSSSNAGGVAAAFRGAAAGVDTGKCPSMPFNTEDMSRVPYSLCARSMMLPPVPSPKSIHRFLERLTLNEGVRSCLKGERYHKLSPCSLTGENPIRRR